MSSLGANISFLTIIYNQRIIISSYPQSGAFSSTHLFATDCNRTYGFPTSWTLNASYEEKMIEIMIRAELLFTF